MKENCSASVPPGFSMIEHFHSAFPLHVAVFPLCRFFFQRIGDMLEQGQIIFGNIVNIALESSTNLWKYDILYT